MRDRLNKQQSFKHFHHINRYWPLKSINHCCLPTSLLDQTDYTRNGHKIELLQAYQPSNYSEQSIRIKSYSFMRKTIVRMTEKGSESLSPSIIECFKLIAAYIPVSLSLPFAEQTENYRGNIQKHWGHDFLVMTWKQSNENSPWVSWRIAKKWPIFASLDFGNLYKGRCIL